jgi:hypothetical protein
MLTADSGTSQKCRFGEPANGKHGTLVPGVVWVAFQDRESAVDLFEQHDAGEFVWERHLAQRDYGVGGFARGLAEAVGWPDREHKRLGTSVLQKMRELLGRKLLATRIEQYKPGNGTALPRQFQQGSFIPKGQAFHLRIAGNSFEIFGGERLNSWVFGFANPRDLEFHERDLTTEGPKKSWTAKRARGKRLSCVYVL